MPKYSLQNSWLNIVIITISGLVLAFTLLGRFMDSATQLPASPPESNQQLKVNIIGIDFGSQKIRYQAMQWQVEPIKTVISNELIQKVVDNWQEILNSPQSEIKLSDIQGFEPVATVLIFLEGSQSPLVAKVEMRAQQLLISFILTGQKVFVEDSNKTQLFVSSLPI